MPLASLRSLVKKEKVAGGLALPARHSKSTLAPSYRLTICPNPVLTWLSFEVSVAGRVLSIRGLTKVDDRPARNCLIRFTDSLSDVKNEVLARSSTMRQPSPAEVKLTVDEFSLIMEQPS